MPRAQSKGTARVPMLAPAPKGMDTELVPYVPMPGELAPDPRWTKVIAYSDIEHSITSWRSWFNVIMLPIRLMCVALLIITQSLTMLTITSASLVSILIIWITR